MFGADIYLKPLHTSIVDIVELGRHPEDELHSSSASNSKTSMADLSGHPIDTGKKGTY